MPARKRNSIPHAATVVRPQPSPATETNSYMWDSRWGQMVIETIGDTVRVNGEVVAQLEEAPTLPG